MDLVKGRALELRRWSLSLKTRAQKGGALLYELWNCSCSRTCPPACSHHVTRVLKPANVGSRVKLLKVLGFCQAIKIACFSKNTTS